MNQAQAAAEEQGGTTYLPEMNPIESSNINAVGYDGINAFVEFKDGTHWMYTNVPASLYTEWMQADSKGSFFHQKIKGQFGSAKWIDNEWVAQNAPEAGNDSESAQTSDSAPSDTDDTVRSDSGAAHPMEGEAQEQAAAENAEAQGNEESQPDTAPEAPEQPTAAGDPASIVPEGEELTDVKSWSWGEEYGLRVTLNNGDQFTYADAPQELETGLAQAGNPTKYYQAQVVPHYEGQQAA